MLQVLLLPRLVLVKQSQELSPEARTERKRKRKRSRAEEQDEEERDLLKSSLPWAGKTAKRHERIVTPQNVIVTQNVLPFDAKCNNFVNAKCNNF